MLTGLQLIQLKINCIHPFNVIDRVFWLVCSSLRSLLRSVEYTLTMTLYASSRFETGAG